MYPPKMNKIIYLIFFSVLLFSCGKVKHLDTTDIKEVMDNSKIKRITEKDFLEKVSKTGEAIEEKLNGDFRIECQSKITLDNQAIELYNTSLLNPEQLKDGKKGELLEAYQFGIENKQAVGSNIQLLNDTLYIYSFPLKENSYLHTMCKNDLAFVLIPKSEIVKHFEGK